MAPLRRRVALASNTTTEIRQTYKDLTGLTSPNGGEFALWSVAEPLGTYDYWAPTDENGNTPPAADDDDAWILPGDETPAQPALVDGHYYGRLTSQYLLDTFTYDWVAQSSVNGGPNFIAVVVHYGTNYKNAFWNGSYVAFGDGDQVTRREYTSLDVMAHELAHGVTDFTSDLIYKNESGALNEAFSDMLGAGAEFYAHANGLEPGGLLPDWLMAEDIDLTGDAEPGFRNMRDPEEDGDPDHYGERYTGINDNGGVHTNSGIPNHAFYLLVNGGLNASCFSPGDHNSVHCTGGETPVTAIGLADAEAIHFLAFTALTRDATMCDARAATEAIAATLFGALSQQTISTTDAWIAVGLTDAVCSGAVSDAPPYDVYIMVPGSGATVSGKRSKAQANANDDIGVAKVEFYLQEDNGNPASPKTLVGVDSDGSNSWLYRWDTKYFSDGPYKMTVVATDGGNPPQSTESAAVPVMVQNSKDGGDGSTGGGVPFCERKPEHSKCSPQSSQPAQRPGWDDAPDGRPTFSRAFEPIPPE